MDNSFTFLSSSMFTKITLSNNKKRTGTKAPTKLALRKNLRRSSIFDHLPSTSKNNNLKLVEDSGSTDSISSNASNSIVIINKTPITISTTSSILGDSGKVEEALTISSDDFLKSEESDHQDNAVKNGDGEKTSSLQETNNCLLSTSKYNAIEKWISEINLPEKHNFDDTNRGSTKQNAFKFDEMLSSLKDTLKSSTSNRQNNAIVANNDDNNCLEKVDVISDSDESEYVVEESDVSLELSDQKRNRINKDPLSRLRGDLPKSEPHNRRNVAHRLNENLPKTERKPKPKTSLLYKNPYLESVKAQTSLFCKDKESPAESPWMKYLKGLCDTESSEESSKRASGLLEGVSKLTDSDEESSAKDFRKNVKLSSTIINEEPNTRRAKQNLNALYDSDKENFSDFSESSETLEDRLRKKLDLNKKTADCTENDFQRKLENVFKASNDDNLVLGKLETEHANIDNKVQTGSSKTTKKSTKTKTKTTVNDLISKTPTVKSTINSDGIVLKSFLASLSATVKSTECDPSALIFRNNFKLYKNELAVKLFKLYNKEIFNNRIPEETPIEWSDRMRGTAGYCYCKKVIRKTGVTERTVRIVLATKVLDSADRLRDTLIHELCHAATWIINEVANGHGNYWKKWTVKAREVFPELPPVKVCHNYDIKTKYTYKCTSCYYSFGRHSKSVDIEKKRCGHCYGKFEVLINKTTKNGETKSVPATPKKATGFALFVKENYALYKTPQLNHGQLMKLLGVKFNELRVSLPRKTDSD